MSHGWNNCYECGCHYHDSESDGFCPRCPMGEVDVAKVETPVVNNVNWEAVAKEQKTIIEGLQAEIRRLKEQLSDAGWEREYLQAQIPDNNGGWK